VVGIETLDDVTVLLPGGRQIREQDKSYTSDKIPLADRSKEFWNSLHIWLKAIRDESLDLELTEFHLVTNRNLNTGLVYELMCLENSENKEKGIAEFVSKLREAGKNPPEHIKEIVQSVQSFADKQLAELVVQLRVSDGSTASYGTSLRQELADKLHLFPKYASQILNGLSGWVHDTALELIRQGKPAWLKREAFTVQLNQLQYRFNDSRFIQETAEALIPIDESERKAQRSKLFVKQMLWVGIDEDDEEIIEAIDDYIRSGSEATRLSQEGLIQPADFKALEDRLVRRWTTVKRTTHPVPLPDDVEAQKTIGLSVLRNTLNHREPLLSGQPTAEHYLTQGAYHKLADEPRVGWHPQYELLLERGADAAGD